MAKFKGVYPDVELTIALQSNKAAQAVALFDVIHSLPHQVGTCAGGGNEATKSATQNSCAG